MALFGSGCQRGADQHGRRCPWTLRKATRTSTAAWTHSAIPVTIEADRAAKPMQGLTVPNRSLSGALAGPPGADERYCGIHEPGEQRGGPHVVGP